MTLGGPQRMVATLESLTGIRIDFWLLTSFQGFTNMVDHVGPLTVYVPRGMHDRFSGADFSRGFNRFWGAAALAFARDRHDVPNGDLSRSLNQGKLIVAALSKLRASFRNDPGGLFKWIATGWRNMRTDLSFQTLLTLALTATTIRSVNNFVVPASTGSVGGVSAVFISPSAAGIYANMRRDGVVG